MRPPLSIPCVAALCLALLLTGCDGPQDGSSSVVSPADSQPATTDATEPTSADASIAAAVESELRAEPSLRELPMRVYARNGIVVLEGTVDNVQTAQHAGVIAAAVDGVIEVDNRLSLGTAP